MEEAITTVADQLHLTEHQKMILDRILYAVEQTFATIGQAGEDGNLLASSSTDNWFSTNLPDDQWILELQNWFVMLLVNLQLYVVDYATGLNNPTYNHYITRASAQQQWMCHNQIVQRDDYTSFSVLGLAIIILSGGLVMFVNVTVSRFWPWLTSRRDRDRRHEGRWRSYELLELQVSEQQSCNEVRGISKFFNKHAGSKIDRLFGGRNNMSQRTLWRAVSVDSTVKIPGTQNSDYMEHGEKDGTRIKQQDLEEYDMERLVPRNI